MKSKNDMQVATITGYSLGELKSNFGLWYAEETMRGKTFWKWLTGRWPRSPVIIHCINWEQDVSVKVDQYDTRLRRSIPATVDRTEFSFTVFFTKE